ncbi:MAG: hypothetical protein AAFX93_09225 [Verrucomicrobiota bacterium]
MLHSYTESQYSRPGGFSLLEIVLVLGLLTLLAGLAASMSLESLFTAGSTKPAAEVFREATHEARLQAINDAELVYLAYDSEKKEFRLSTASAPALSEDEEEEVASYGPTYWEEEDAEVETPATDAPKVSFPVYDNDLIVEFYGLQAGQDGPSVFSREFTDEPIPNIVFHPSGVSSPAVAIFKFSNGDDMTLTLDSFSNGPKLSLESGDSY